MITSLITRKQQFEVALKDFLQAKYSGNSNTLLPAGLGKQGDDGSPLFNGIRYVMAGEGKRVRAILCELAAESCGSPRDHAFPAAFALEMVHAYSLVHDDLPIMDNDDFRRGRPTVHKVFGDAVALLVGDALLTDAFEVVASQPSIFNHPPNVTYPECEILPASTLIMLTKELATAAGSQGMVYGQNLDLFWTARAGHTIEDLNLLHLNKTGKLIGAATAMGAIVSRSSNEVIDGFRKFGQLIGLAFQINDDLIDELNSTGKTAGKDRIQGKLTYLTHLSEQKARELAHSVTEEAISAIKCFSLPIDPLIAFARELLQRNL